MIQDLVEDHALHRRLLTVMALVSPMRAVGVAKKRYGRDFDGGYVLLEGIERTRITYSLGICDDVSWDRIMADFGSEVFQYDHTIEEAPDAHPLFRFFRIGIAPSDDVAPNLRRLDTLVRRNGHAAETGMLLKIDIEQHEWFCFDTIDEDVLGRFDQIVCEFHHTGHFNNDEWLSRAERALAKLHRTHQVVHVHANNHAPINVIAGVPIPDVFELTFANRKAYAFEFTDEVFPTELDRPCTPTRPELYLGSFSYRPLPGSLVTAAPRRICRLQGDLSDARCVLCDGSSLRSGSTVEASDRVQRGAIRCETCGGSYDVIDGVPFLGSYDEADYAGLVEIVATAEMNPIGFEIADVRTMGALLDAYHAATDKPAFAAASDDSRVRESWFPYRYHEWLQTQSILGGRSIAGKTLLNVGAGTGIDSVHLVDLGANVTCIDYSPSLATVGRRSLPGARWLGGFSHVLPFQDETFDVVCANAALHHMRSVPAALREMLRVLKPGGFMFTTGDPFRADASGDQHEFDVFDRHVGVLAGINEGIVRFSDIYEPVRAFSQHVSIALIADVVGGDAMSGLSGTSPIGDGTFGDRWVPCWDENTNLLAASYGALALTVTKNAALKIPAATQAAGGLSAGILASWIAEGDAAYRHLAEWAPREVIDLPFPGRTQTWFDLLNGWTMPEAPYDSRRGYRRTRWLLTAPPGSASLRFSVRALSDGPDRTFEVTLDGLVATSATVDRRWREVEVPLTAARAGLPLLFGLRWQGGSEPDSFEEGCFEVRDRGFVPAAGLDPGR